MKEVSQKPLIKAMYYASNALFGVHLAFLCIILLGNYFDPLGYFHGEKPRFTIRGNVKVVEEKWRPMHSNEQIEIKDSIGLKPVFLLQKSGFARIDYTDFSKAFTLRNTIITVLDMACWWIWLVLTYQLMKIISSLKSNIVFDLENVRRLRFIALVFGIAPVIDYIKNALFANLLKSVLHIQQHFIWSQQHHNLYAGIAIMLLIFVLVEIFRYGLLLQKENDLTI